MSLKGKILNTWEVDTGSITQSQEVKDISLALGLEPGCSDLNGHLNHYILALNQEQERYLSPPVTELWNLYQLPKCLISFLLKTLLPESSYL